MSPIIISVLCWIPFLLVALICGIVFALRGYKRGAARAGVSVGATVVSALLALGLAKLLAFALRGVLFSAFGLYIIGELPAEIDADMAQSLVMGLLYAASATVLYVPMLALCASAVKCVTAHFIKKVIPEPKQKGNRIGGIAVSVADALLLALLLWIPIYGTLGVAGDVMGIAAGDDTEIIEYFDAASSPVPCTVSNVPPFSWLYDSMTSFRYEGSSVSISKTARYGVPLAQAINTYRAQGATLSNTEAVRDVLHATEDFLQKNKFVTDIACVLIANQSPKMQMPGVGEIALIHYYPALGNGDLLRDDLCAILELANALNDSGMLCALSDESLDTAEVDGALLAQALGDTLNHSNSIASFKTHFIQDMVRAMAEEAEQGGNDPNGAFAALCDAVMQLSDQPLEQAQRKQEGDALYLLFNGVMLSTKGNETQTGQAVGYLLEGLARHPAIGTDTVMNTADAFMAANGITLTDSLHDSILTNLNASLVLPVQDSTFSLYCYATMNTAIAFDKIASGESGAEHLEILIGSDPAIIQAVKETVSTDLLSEVGMGAQAENVQTVLDTVFQCVSDSSLTGDAAKAESEALNEMLRLVDDATADRNDAGSLIVKRADEIVEKVATSSVLKESLRQLTESKQSDPLGMFAKVSKNVKTTLQDEIDRYCARNGDNQTLQDLALFMGLE